MPTDRTLEELYGVGGEDATTPREVTRADLQRSSAKARSSAPPKKPVKPSEARSLQSAAQAARDEQAARARAGLGAVEEQGPPLPASVAERERVRTARDRQNDVLMGNPAIAAAALAGQGSTVKVPRKTFGAEQEYLGSTLGLRRDSKTGKMVDVTQINELTGERERVPGAVERQRLAHGEIMTQAEAEAEIYADRLRRDEAELAAADEAVVRNNQRRIGRIADEVDAVQRQAAGITRATDAMEASPDLSNWWQSRTAGQKTAAVISAFLLGVGGRNPLEAINAAIAEEQHRAKFNFEKRSAVKDARLQEQGALMNVYDTVAEHAGSELEADRMAQLAMYENARRRVERMAAESQSRILPAQHQLLSAQLDEEIAKRRYELQQMAVASTPTRSVWVPRFGRGVAKAIRSEGTKQADFGRDVEMKGIESGYRQQEEAAKAEGGLGDKNIETDPRYNSAQAGIDLIDQMLLLSEQSGGGEPGRFGPITAGGVLGDADPLVSEEAEGFRQMQTDLEGILQEHYGGASPTPAQIEAARRDTGADAGSGGQSIRALKRTRERLQRAVEQQERKLGEGHRKHRARNEALPEAAPRHQSTRMPDSYEPE